MLESFCQNSFRFLLDFLCLDKYAASKITATIYRLSTGKASQYNYLNCPIKKSGSFESGNNKTPDPHTTAT